MSRLPLRLSVILLTHESLTAPFLSSSVWRQMVTSQRSTEIPGGVIRARPDPRANAAHLPAPDSKDPYYPILRTRFGTLYFPKWLSKGGAIFAMATVLLVLMCTGVIRTFARIEERNCLAMLIFCSILWATEVRRRPCSYQKRENDWLNRFVFNCSGHSSLRYFPLGSLPRRYPSCHPIE